MKILIVSDTHGNEKNLRRVLKTEKPVDRMLHLGDSEATLEHLEQTAGCPVDVVAGNCDYFNDLPLAKCVELAGHRLLLTHGHHQYVSFGTEDLEEFAADNGCDIVLYGHTHVPDIRKTAGGLTVLNPGSLTHPRQEGRKPTYIIMELDTDGRFSLELKTV